jgi:uncharacterized protein involved in exopolysaccharide biosynthesis
MADTIVNTPQPQVQSDNSGWIVAVIILLVVIIVGGYYFLHHRTYIATTTPSTTVQVNLPAGSGSTGSSGSTQ